MEPSVADSAITLAKTSAHRNVIAYTPASGLAAIRDLLAQTTATEFEYVPQPNADLGQRMEALFRDRFDEGVEQVVVVGSDRSVSPELDRGRGLLGPGYSSSGPGAKCGRRVLPVGPEFSRRACLQRGRLGAPGGLLEQTLGKVQDHSLGLLPPWYDVDSSG